MKRQQIFSNLIEEFIRSKQSGKLECASEETIRTWINRMLEIFGWDVGDTKQIMQERSLDKTERQKLHKIGSTYTKPDYTMMNGNVRLFFLDAKKCSVNIENDRDVAFQIRSYGWSIGASYSIVTDFEEMAIYDCHAMPKTTDSAEFARLHYLKCEDYAENFDLINSYLGREKAISNYRDNRFVGSESLDVTFSNYLCHIRLKLAISIMNNNGIVSISDLNLWTQIILNRILFIRVCEARGLEEEGLLLRFSESGFWEQFKKCSYFTFYEHYDGPMFQRISALQNLVIDNDILVDFLSMLYYPSPYCFDVIPIESISGIYDIFLGYHLEYDITNRLTNVLKSEFRKSNGAITTPKPLVDKTLELTIGNILSNKKTVDEILSYSFLDPACGSGVFLVSILDLIERNVIRLLKEDRQQWPTTYYDIINGEPVINISGKKLLLSRCLYGVDINQESVEVAKLSLSLKIIDGYNIADYEKVGIFGSKILEGIGTNIKCGNSLVSADILQYYPHLIDRLDEYDATNVFDWDSAFPNVFNKGGFDFVVGNPPYVEVKNYNVDLPTMASYIKQCYNSSKNGKIDLAIPFIEKGLQLLNPSGRLGYIVQKRFFKTDYGKSIRMLLSRQRLLDYIYDYHETNLFAGRITYVSIVVCDKSDDKTDTVTYQSSLSDVPIRIPKDSITETPWSFENSAVNTIRFEKSNKLGTLKEVCDIKVGVQVLWDPAFHIYVTRADKNYIYGRTSLEDNLKLEKKACRVLICNEHFVPFSIRPETTYIIFPYDVKNGEPKQIPFSRYQKRYPLAGAYLLRYKTRIISEVQTYPDLYPSFSKEEYWHLFTRANNHDAVYRKICVPMTAQEPQASILNNENAYCDNANMFFIKIAEATDERLYALSAIINSTPFSTFAKSIANPQQGDFYKFNKQFLGPVPFPTKEFNESTSKIRELATIGKKIEEIHTRIAKSQTRASRFYPLVTSLWNQLDNIVCELYGLSETEKNIVMSNKRKDRVYGKA